MNWSQLWTILWLRWRLSRNQWGRGGTLNAILSVLAAVGIVLLSLGGLIGGFLGGFLGLAQAPPQVLLIAWDIVLGVFLFFWMLGIVAEIQRSETIDIARLLHLPVSLKEIFLVNYVASHLTLIIIVALPALFGFVAGLSTSRGGAMLVLLPLALSFIFMVTAWTYCLRGWLVSLMVNQRRRRTIIAGITVAFIVLAQLPNFYFNALGGRNRARSKAVAVPTEDSSKTSRTHTLKNALSPAFLAAHKYIPPLWVANGAMALAQGKAGPALLGSVGLLVLGGLGLRRAYRATLRFYRGETNKQPVKPRPGAISDPASAGNFLEAELPVLPGEVAALALASFRSITRAPEVKMALLTSFVMLAVFGVMLISGNSNASSERALPFIATTAVVFVQFGMLQLLFNQFGFDRDGFRVLVLLPARRRNILLGKNLAFLPIVLSLGLILLTALKVIMHVPWLTMMAAALQLGAAFLLVCLAGNVASVLAPYRIAAGSLKPTKTSTKTSVLIVLFHLAFPLLMLPIFIPPAVELACDLFGWRTFAPLNLLLSLVLAAVASIIYWFSLEQTGALLQRREREVLQAVTHEVD